MLSSAHLTEEGVEGVFSLNGLVTWHRTIWLNVMLQAIEFLGRTANMDNSLANMEGDAFLCGCCFVAAEQMAERKRLFLLIVQLSDGQHKRTC